MFPGKLKSKLTGPYFNTQLLPHDAVEFENKEGVRFKANGQQRKIYLGHAEMANGVIGHIIVMKYKQTRVLRRAVMLNQDLILR